MIPPLHDPSVQRWERLRAAGRLPAWMRALELVTLRPLWLRAFDRFSEWAIEHAIARVHAAEAECSAEPLCEVHGCRVAYWSGYAIGVDADRIALGLPSLVRR